MEKNKMDMRKFSEENRIRCEAKSGFDHPLEDWSMSDWMTATAGELGEAANVIKKLNRLRDGIINPKGESQAKLEQKLQDETADVFIYLDLMAQAAGFYLNEAVSKKFDETSRKIGYIS